MGVFLKVGPLPESPSPNEVLILSWLNRVRSGEVEVFAHLVEAYKNPIYSQFFRWVGKSELAEEMTQDVFLKAYQKIHSFREDSKFSTWLFQIALNRARDFWRQQKKGISVPLDPNFLTSKESDSDVETQNEDKREIVRLRSALEHLKPKYREALSLRFLSELSFQEIADQTGEGLSNIKMRVLRGLEALRKIIDQSSKERSDA